MNCIVDGGSRCLQGLQRGWSREPRETGSGRQKVSASCLGALFQIGAAKSYFGTTYQLCFGTAFLSMPYVMMQTQQLDIVGIIAFAVQL